MPPVPYFGSYVRFNAVEKEQGVRLLGADCLVGDELSLVVEKAGTSETVWLENRFGGRCGKLEGAGTGHVLLCQAKGWEVHALLASVYASGDEEGALHYWGEVVLMAFPPHDAASFRTFVSNIGELLAKGARPKIDLAQSSLNQIIRTEGAWLPSDRVPALDKEDSALVKDHLGFKEQMIEQARKRNPGCLAVGWAFIAALVLGLLWLVKSLMGF